MMILMYNEKWMITCDFKEVCAQELDAKYFYQDWKSDPYYYSSWAKIRINDTTSVMADMVNYPTHNGIV